LSSLIRNSLAFVSWKDRKIIMPDLKAIYRAETAEGALAELDAFEAQWGRRYPTIGQAWRRAWEPVVPLFAFPPAIRKMIYTSTSAARDRQHKQPHIPSDWLVFGAA
jgi:putative transposase